MIHSDGRELLATLVKLRPGGRELERGVLDVRKDNARSLSVALALHGSKSGEAHLLLLVRPVDLHRLLSWNLSGPDPE